MSNLVQYKIVGSSLLATRLHNAIYVRADQIKMGQTLENFKDKTKIAVLKNTFSFIPPRSARARALQVSNSVIGMVIGEAKV